MNKDVEIVINDGITPIGVYSSYFLVINKNNKNINNQINICLKELQEREINDAKKSFNKYIKITNDILPEYNKIKNKKYKCKRYINKKQNIVDRYNFNKNKVEEYFKYIPELENTTYTPVTYNNKTGDLI